MEEHGPEQRRGAGKHPRLCAAAPRRRLHPAGGPAGLPTMWPCSCWIAPPPSASSGCRRTDVSAWPRDGGGAQSWQCLRCARQCSRFPPLPELRVIREALAAPPPADVRCHATHPAAKEGATGTNLPGGKQVWATGFGVMVPEGYAPVKILQQAAQKLQTLTACTTLYEQVGRPRLLVGTRAARADGWCGAAARRACAAWLGGMPAHAQHL